MRISNIRRVVSVLSISLVASTAGAAERTPSSSLWTASQGAGARASAQMQTAAAPATGDPSADSGGFFKTGRGKAVLSLMVAAAGFTVYSKYHDRIKSVIR